MSSKKCEFCGSTENLELDRAEPGAEGGQYTDENTRWLCETCHHVRHGNYDVVFDGDSISDENYEYLKSAFPDMIEWARSVCENSKIETVRPDLIILNDTEILKGRSAEFYGALFDRMETREEDTLI